MDLGEFYRSAEYQSLVSGFDGVEPAYDERETTLLRAHRNATELGTFFNIVHFGMKYDCNTCSDTRKVTEQVLWADGWGMATKRCPDCD